MGSLWMTIPMAICTAAVLSFLYVRLQLYKVEHSGGPAYVAGSVLVLAAATWNAIASIPDYSNWFVITAYPILTTFLYVVLAAGLVLLAISLALYADLHRTRREELELRENRLSVLQNLQLETRASYQLLELLTLTLREILSPTPERAGVAFLINRGKRQLILGASTNLTKNEIANLEHVTIDNNIVAQAVDLGDPMITGPFELTNAKGAPIQSRFQSGLVLPLISGSERIGALVLLAEEPRSFSRTELLYLSPVADWVAEKIRSARLTRELTLARTELEQVQSSQQGLVDRLAACAQSLSGPAALIDFCRHLVGLAGSTEAHLCGIVGSSLQMYGGTESLPDLSEQYRLTLTDALERRKPLIINHESSDKDGHVSIVRSTLVFPLTPESSDALLLRKEGGPFTVSDRDLRILGFFGLLARFALQQRETSRRDLTRRVGFEKIIQLIQPSMDSNTPGDKIGSFMRLMVDILPAHSQSITLVKRGDATFAAADAVGVDSIDLVELVIESGEGLVSEAVNSGTPKFVFGKRQIHQCIETFSPSTQHAFHRSFGERRLPQLLAVCPLAGVDGITEVVIFFLYELPESERAEWERLLTLAVGLFGLRLNMLEFSRGQDRQLLSTEESERVAPLINALNNHLSAIMGNAELAATREEVSGELRTLLKSIVAESENAARMVKKTRQVTTDGSRKKTEPAGEFVNDVVDTILRDIHISGNLYMVGGRPRELDIRLGAAVGIHFANNEIRSLFDSVLNRFAAIASDEDVISISTYVAEHFLYLDISRHRKNFPPVEPVAHFGDYQAADVAFQHRPSDVYLKSVSQGVCFYAADHTGPTPAYLSFKFPIRSTVGAAKPGQPSRQFRVLAIDDQTVILDLVTAMCQSMGYDIQTASNGSEGLRMAISGRFDIILTDLAMPDLTGLEVARQIRAVQPNVPIILVTGWEAGLDQSEISAAGINEVLLKPFRIEQLTDIIRAAALKSS